MDGHPASLSTLQTFCAPGKPRSALRIVAAAAIAIASASGATADELLRLEAKIPLGQVEGRIDHMAFDLAHRRLFVAELGNNSVGVVDIEAKKVVHRIFGLRHPQGVGYVPALDLLFVASAGDGSVRLFGGAQYADAGRLDLGDDADNIRVDAAVNRVLVGYGEGALAVIDPASRRKMADIRLTAHPESFQVDPVSKRIFVNLPGSRAIATVDPGSNRATNWPMQAGGNFPMALRAAAQHVVVVFRRPAKLGVFAMADGASIAAPETCGDSDDVFDDTKRNRLYVSCGDGSLDVFDTQGYRRIAHMQTASGARTALFVPEIDRLFVAVRAGGSQPAAIWVYRPAE